MIKLSRTYNDLICPICLKFKFQYLERLADEEGEPTSEMLSPQMWENALMQGTCNPCNNDILSCLKSK